MATNARIRLFGRNRSLVLGPLLRRPSMEHLEPRWLLSAGIALLGEPVGDGPYAISGIVFEDLNANASRDVGEPGLGGWAVQLLDSDGTLLQTVLTDTLEAGAYRFVGLNVGDYLVRGPTSSTWVQTLPQAGAHPVSLVGEDIEDVDFGNMQFCTIRGRKFNDANRNRAQDGLEEGLNGWTIELYEEGELIEFQTTRTIGVTDGRYMFVDVMPGAYRLEEILQAGWSQTAPLDPWVTLTSGQNLTVNFGNVELGTISGLVFDDLDASASYEAGEPGLGGWTVQLLDGDGMPLLDGDGMPLETVTDPVGMFAFENLDAGNYQVRQVVSSTWTQTVPEGTTYSVTLVNGEHREDVNFGNVQLCTIRGRKFYDIDMDGERDPGEEGLNGWTIELYAGPGDPIALQLTRTIGGEDGRYMFTDLMPGTYTVGEILQGMWFQTAPVDPVVILTSGQNETIDFGNAPYEEIGVYAEAVDDSATVIDPDNATVVDVLANDQDLPDPLSLGFITGVTDGLFGTVAIVNNGLAVSYLPTGGFAGDSFTYTISHDGNESTATVNVEVVNTALGDLQMHHTRDQLDVALPQSSVPADTIVYSATALAPDAYVRRIQGEIALEFYLWPWDNWYERGEKWLQDALENWYYMLPDGGLYDGASDVLIAQIGKTYYDEPSLIIDGLGGADEPEVTAIVAGGQLTLDPPLGFVGVVTVELTATLGPATVVTQFDLAVTNTLEPPDVADQTVSTLVDTFTLPELPLTDTDGDALAYWASVQSPSQAAFDIKDGLGLVSYLPEHDNLYDLEEKWVLDDGGNWYYILPDGGVYQPDTGLPTGRVSRTYYDDPQALIDAVAPIAPDATVSVVDNWVTINPADGFVGSFTVELWVEDGAGMAVTTFQVNVTADVPD